MIVGMSLLPGRISSCHCFTVPKTTRVYIVVHVYAYRNLDSRITTVAGMPRLRDSRVFFR